MKDGERRITITCYDNDGYDLAIHYPLYKFIEFTKETGECVCRFEGDKMAYIKETKAGYALKTWKEEGRGQ